MFLFLVYRAHQLWKYVLLHFFFCSCVFFYSRLFSIFIVFFLHSYAIWNFCGLLLSLLASILFCCQTTTIKVKIIRINSDRIYWDFISLMLCEYYCIAIYSLSFHAAVNFLFCLHTILEWIFYRYMFLLFFCAKELPSVVFKWSFGGNKSTISKFKYKKVFA